MSNFDDDPVLKDVFNRTMAGMLGLPIDDDPGRIIVFHRDNLWYPVWHKDAWDLQEHIDKNPGTTAVSDVDGVVFWSIDPMKPIGYSLLKEGTMYQ